MKALREPVTTENRQSFIDAENKLRVWDQPGHCAACTRCLLSAHRRCPCAGPFNAQLQYDPRAWVPK